MSDELQRVCAPVAVRRYDPAEDDTETLGYFPLLDNAVRWVTALLDAGWLLSGDYYAVHEDGRRVSLVMHGTRGRNLTAEESVLVARLVRAVCEDVDAREDERAAALRLRDDFGWHA